MLGETSLFILNIVGMRPLRDSYPGLRTFRPTNLHDVVKLECSAFLKWERPGPVSWLFIIFNYSVVCSAERELHYYTEVSEFVYVNVSLFTM